MTTFLEKYFLTLCSITNSNCTYDLICENFSIVTIVGSPDKIEFISNNQSFIDNLKKEFVPCFCDCGHPVLVALRNYDKLCICSKSYIKVLQRSPSFPTKSVLARVIGHTLTKNDVHNYRKD